MTPREMALQYARGLFPHLPAIWVGDRYIVVSSLTNREPVFSIQYSCEDNNFINHTLTGRDLDDARSAIVGKAADI